MLNKTEELLNRALIHVQARILEQDSQRAAELADEIEYHLGLHEIAKTYRRYDFADIAGELGSKL